MALLLLTLVAVFLSINAGAMRLSLKEVFSSLFGLGDIKSNAAVRNLRLPRITAGLLAGAGLSVSGCVMQNTLRNPLASPSTLGISNAAAFGANVAIILLGAGQVLSTGIGEVKITNPYMVTLCAFIAAMLCTFVIILLSRMRRFSPESIVLAGVALSSLFSAGTMIIQYFSDDPAKVAAVIFWTFGNLNRASWNEILIMAILILLSLCYFIFRRWDYNAIDSGEDTAKSLGVKVERIRLGGLFLSSLITAVSVSFLGIIAFIGLVAPQITKRIIGNDNRYLIPASAITGALILTVSDTIARMLLSPRVLPVGAVTSFLGAPLFIYLLIRGENRL